MSTEDKKVEPEIPKGPKVGVYIHIFNEKEKGIIETYKMTLIAQIIRVIDLKAELARNFNNIIKSNIRYIPQEICKTMYAKPLKDTAKIRTYFNDGDDMYIKVATEVIPVETEKKDVVLTYKTLTNYSFYVASSTIVRVIVPVPGIEKVPKENISATFTETSLEVKIKGAQNGINYRFAVPMLDAKIIPDKCEAFGKNKDLIIRLRKFNNDDHWSYLFKQKYIGE